MTRLLNRPRGALALAVIVATPGCYRSLAPLPTPEGRRAWIERLGIDAKAPATCEGALDEAGLLARALAGDPEIASLEGEARWLEAAADASYAPVPQLRLSGLRTDEIAAGEPRFTTALRVPFARPGTLDAKADELRQEALVARAKAAERRRELRRELRLALVRHAGWRELERMAAIDRARAEAELARLRAGAELKQVSAIDLAAGEVVLLEAQGTELRARAEAAHWLAALQAAVGGCSFGDPAIDVPDLAGRDALVDDALGQRPSLALRAAQAGVAAARTWEARSLAWPWLDFAQVGYQLDNPAAPDSWVFSLAIDLPIGAWDGAHVEAAEREERAVEDAARHDAARVVAEIDAAISAYHAADDALAGLTRVFDGVDRQRLEALRTGARNGTVDPADVYDLERDLGRLERRRIEARIALGEARAELLAALDR
jgi:outer membrane protein TolC